MNRKEAPQIDDKDDYYSASLKLLVWLAKTGSAPNTVIDLPPSPPVCLRAEKVEWERLTM
ncbi:hypothetical protein LN650_02965 [Klebsiella pneumoniae subsp. pneumoniae]|nr:hypothetical protein [Klebsiella pneumoniae subsp. pneumoniae]